MTARLKSFDGCDQRVGKYARRAGWRSYDACHMVLEVCLDKWSELVEDLAYGQAMRHVLLDCTTTEKISDRVLASCVPALCLAERARGHRDRVRHIARCVAACSRMRGMAAAELVDAVDQYVSLGRLLHAAQLEQYKPYELTLLAGRRPATAKTLRQRKRCCARAEVIRSVGSPWWTCWLLHGSSNFWAVHRCRLVPTPN